MPDQRTPKDIQVGSLKANGDVTPLIFNITNMERATSAGVGSGASIPAAVEGYFVVYIGGVKRHVPFFPVS